MPRSNAERYWDERARENALFFVDNELDYRNPDEEQFWQGGEEALDRFGALAGLTIGADETIVDIGCGIGRMTRALAARSAHVIGIDVSSEMIARAREQNAHLTNVEWVHGDGRTLAPIADASVDGCFSHVVFQHIPDPQVTLGYIAEMGRVLRPDGWALFVLSTNPVIHRRVDPLLRVRLAFRALAKHGPRSQADPAWIGSAVDLHDVRATAERSGLVLENVVAPQTQFTGILCRRLP